MEGSLATSNLVVYTLDEDLNTAQTTGNGTDPLDDRNSLWRYNIGAGPEPWSTMPTKVASPLIGFVATSVTVDLDRGADGKFYMMQNRFNGLESRLVRDRCGGCAIVEFFDRISSDSSTNHRAFFGEPGRLQPEWRGGFGRLRLVAQERTAIDQ